MATDKDQPVIAQQSVVAKESDTKNVFGMDALNMQTPDKVKAIFKVITFSIWVIALAANTFFASDAATKVTILEITGFLTLVLQKAEDFFGIEIDK